MIPRLDLACQYLITVVDALRGYVSVLNVVLGLVLSLRLLLRLAFGTLYLIFGFSLLLLIKLTFLVLPILAFAELRQFMFVFGNPGLTLPA